MPDLLQSVQAMKPVFVLAPTARNGITLLQRLFNSTGQIMVFGENVDMVERWPMLVQSAVQMHTRFGAAMQASRQRFLQSTEYWSSDLWPDTQGYAAVALEAFARIAALYEQAAREAGRPRWGVKNPMTHPAAVDWLLPLLPGARFVVLYRHVLDVLRSAKARKFVQSPQEVALMAQRWRDHLQAVLDRPRPQVHVLRYEDLMHEPDRCLAELERFADVRGMNPAVLQRKINTFQGSTEAGHSPTGYIEPAELTDAERDAALGQAGDMLRRLGYPQASADGSA